MVSICFGPFQDKATFVTNQRPRRQPRGTLSDPSSPNIASTWLALRSASVLQFMIFAGGGRIYRQKSSCERWGCTDFGSEGFVAGHRSDSLANQQAFPSLAAVGYHLRLRILKLAEPALLSRASQLVLKLHEQCARGSWEGWKPDP